MKIKLNQNVLYKSRILSEGEVIESSDDELLPFGEKLEEPASVKVEAKQEHASRKKASSRKQEEA